jgi:hypothetical protein
MGPNDRRQNDRFFWLGLVLVGLLCCGGFSQALGEEASGTPVLSPAAQDSQGNLKSSLTLEPFYILLEDAARVRVQRLDVTLILNGWYRQSVEVTSPRLREKVYDFFTSSKAGNSPESPERQRALVELVNRYLGQEAVAAVKVDRSTLLLR